MSRQQEKRASSSEGEANQHGGEGGHARTGLAALTLGALGIVFGDIGTSPLYALKTVFTAEGHRVSIVEADVYGVISLMVWSVTLIVSITYLTFIMKADNDGEGGIMALIALVRGTKMKNRIAQVGLVLLGLFGVSLFYGDGMITPAISVLSAVEGLKEIEGIDVGGAVVPIALALLTGLFVIQRHGTHVVGRMFGPIMVLWFTVLAVAGLTRVVKTPEILRALSPHYAVEFVASHPFAAFIAMGSVVLTVTGAEALYADMGHFGRKPISRAWYFAVFPALVLNYLGQASLVLENPADIASPFFRLLPSWATIPAVVLATMATLIASQAVISGAFSVTRQAVQLGFLPRLSVRHTSEKEIGQVYVPAINWALFVAVMALVVGFGSSEKLASAYGIAVTGTLIIDAILFLVIVRVLWKKPRWVIAAGIVGILAIDVVFFAANLPKVLHGGWFPLVVGIVIFGVLSTWDKGRARVTDARTAAEGPLQDFIEMVRAKKPPLPRLTGSAIYLNPGIDTAPLALRASAEHIRAIHESVLIVSVNVTNVPHVPDSERVKVDDLGYSDDGISHVSLFFGFQDDPNVPLALAGTRKLGLETDVNPYHASYFLSQVTVIPGKSAGMGKLRKKLFVTLARNAANPIEYFHLPMERTVALGSRIEV